MFAECREVFQIKVFQTSKKNVQMYKFKKVFGLLTQKMADAEDEYHLVEHELHLTDSSSKPMVELEIAQSMVDSMRAHIVSSESSLATTSDELTRARALITRQKLTISTLQRTIADRDTTLEHCTSSLMGTTSQYQTALTALKERDETIQELKAKITEMEIQYDLTREELKREMEEFKVYKQCHVQSKRVHQRPEQQSPPKSDSRGFMSSMLEPTLFR
jgi:chromosome segregation ATPase